MSFIFKGGSCLLLLLKKPMRLSADIDIVVDPGTDVDGYIRKASTIFPFEKSEEQVRVGKNKIEKRHFKFTYRSPITGRDIYILLDVLFEENNYKKPVSEIAYRGPGISWRDVLNDTIEAALCVAARGKISAEEYQAYVRGARDVRTNIFMENYSTEIAAKRAPKVIYSFFP